MNSAIAIAAENLSKMYQIGHKASGSFRETLTTRFRDIFSSSKESPEEFWALDNISFEVKQGEVLGIIGKNGAGKSTLLKILSRITEPTKGRAIITGRVSSLLEVGTGFHPELSGRENIFLNGAILGMKRAETRSKFDEIVSFSGIEQFIDTPVKRYSSGMYVRLAFAVAAHLEPEILIIDEVLAVGDAEFQRKCLGKMKDVSDHDGRTVLFVSHNLGAVAELCTTGLFLKNGRTGFKGRVDEMISLYMQQVERASFSENNEGGKALRFTGSNLLNARNEPTNVFNFTEPILVDMDFSNNSMNSEVHIGLAIRDFSGKKLFTTVFCKQDLTKGSNHVRVRIPSHTLLQGHYTTDIAIFNSHEAFDYQEHKLSLIVTDTTSPLHHYKSEEIGSIHVSCEWH
jgi:lipopolysaccharide transport system ATP-binding protein